MIDSHLHLQDHRFRGKVPAIIDSIRSEGIQTLVVNGTAPEDWEAVSSLATEYDEVIPFFGLHPWKVNEVIDTNWKEHLVEMLNRHPEAGIGEIGLDRWIRDHDLDAQREAFLFQLGLAEKMRRTLAIHCLQAWGSLRDCLEDTNLSVPFLLHSYGGPGEMLEQFVSLGARFSISGYFFRPDKAKKLTVFEQVPEDRILLETDAPDMLPPPDLIRYPMETDSGETITHPSNLVLIYQAYANWAGLDLGDAMIRMRENFANWYRSDRP